MKKLFLLLIVCFSVSTSFGQNITYYPIPSYNVTVDGYGNFSNSSNQDSPCNLEKRKAIIKTTSYSSVNPDCQINVWVYSLDQTTVLGPYTMTCNETLSVDIDEREWGVLVESQTNVSVDVWYSE